MKHPALIVLFIAMLAPACTNPTHWNWAAVYSMRKTERQEANEWKRFSAAYAKHLEEQKP